MDWNFPNSPMWKNSPNGHSSVAWTWCGLEGDHCAPWILWSPIMAECAISTAPPGLSVTGCWTSQLGEGQYSPGAQSNFEVRQAERRCGFALQEPRPCWNSFDLWHFLVHRFLHGLMGYMILLVPEHALVYQEDSFHMLEWRSMKLPRVASSGNGCHRCCLQVLLLCASVPDRRTALEIRVIKELLQDLAGEPAMGFFRTSMGWWPYENQQPSNTCKQASTWPNWIRLESSICSCWTKTFSRAPSQHGPRCWTSTSTIPGHQWGCDRWEWTGRWNWNGGIEWTASWDGKACHCLWRYLHGAHDKASISTPSCLSPRTLMCMRQVGKGILPGVAGI